MNNFNIKNLIFQEKDVEIITDEIKKINEVDYYIITVKSKDFKLPITCPRCGSKANFERKDYYFRTIRELKIHNINVIIRYKQARLRCKECKKGINEILDFVKPSSRTTIKLDKEIHEQLSLGSSMTQVSINTGVSITTVENKIINNVEVNRSKLTECLCFDEFSGPAFFSKYAFIIVDPYKSEIIDIVPSNKQNYLFNYFKKIPLEERENVKYIVTDLTNNYKAAIKYFFPKAIHIADRYHWIRIVIDAVQDLRIKTMKFHLNAAYNIAKTYAKDETAIERAAKESDDYKIYYILKRNYKLLSYNTFDNNYETYLSNLGKMYNKKTPYTNQELLEFILNHDKDLEEAYSFLQKFYKIAYTATIEDARKKINEWINEIKKSNKYIGNLRNATLTIESWITPIVNSFRIDDKKIGLLSNGPCEAKNNCNKTIIKAGYGYKDPYLLRKLILLEDRERTDRRNSKKEKQYNNYIKKAALTA